MIISQQRIGTLPKEEQVGKTVTQYKAALAKAGHNFESVDVATALGGVMAIKDDDELVCIWSSSKTYTEQCSRKLSEPVPIFAPLLCRIILFHALK